MADNVLKYNCTVMEFEGRSMYFVTKRAAFSEAQLNAVARDIVRKEKEAQDARLSKFPVPSRQIFLSDIKAGIRYCRTKYNVCDAWIVEEAKKAFPGNDVEKWLGIKPTPKVEATTP